MIRQGEGDKKSKTCVLGSIGDDDYGELYKKLLEKENIIPIFETFEEKMSGICVVYCYKKERGHLTDLAASTLISEKFAFDNWKYFKEVELVFTELFILKHKKEIVYMLAELGLPTDKTFGFNLPSFYFIETFFEDIKILIEYGDVIFVNENEAKFFGELLGKVTILIRKI